MKTPEIRVPRQARHIIRHTVVDEIDALVQQSRRIARWLRDG